MLTYEPLKSQCIQECQRRLVHYLVCGYDYSAPFSLVQLEEKFSKGGISLVGIVDFAFQLDCWLCSMYEIYSVLQEHQLQPHVR